LLRRSVAAENVAIESVASSSSSSPSESYSSSSPADAFLGITEEAVERNVDRAVDEGQRARRSWSTSTLTLKRTIVLTRTHTRTHTNTLKHIHIRTLTRSHTGRDDPAAETAQRAIHFPISFPPPFLFENKHSFHGATQSKDFPQFRTHVRKPSNLTHRPRPFGPPSEKLLVLRALGSLRVREGYLRRV